MNRQQLVEKLIEKTGDQKAEKVLVALMKTVKETVAAGEPVQLVNFGTFEVRNRAARTSHNPATGGTVNIPAKKVPAFKAGKAFKEMVNQ